MLLLSCHLSSCPIQLVTFFTFATIALSLVTVGHWLIVSPHWGGATWVKDLVAAWAMQFNPPSPLNLGSCPRFSGTLVQVCRLPPRPPS